MAADVPPSWSSESREAIASFVERAEHPEEVETDLLELLIRTDFNEHPYRNPERLEAAWDEHESVGAVALAFQTRRKTVSKWLHLYGIATRQERMTLGQLAARGYLGGDD